MHILPSRLPRWLSDNLLDKQETQETRIRSLGPEDPLEEEMATHSSIPAWKISWTEEPGGLPVQRAGCKELDMTEQLSTHAQ